MTYPGRNEPCFCGSGKKYKKCCLAKEQETASRQLNQTSAVPRALDWLVKNFPEQLRKGVGSGLQGCKIDRTTGNRMDSALFVPGTI
jgi:hypothetical protein